MKRRQFLQLSGLTTTAALIPGFLKAFETNLSALSGKRIVIVQLSGGNDGLNTLVPFSNNIYYEARPRLAIAADQVLKISDDAGFHPALLGMKYLYDEGMMSIYNSVGYPNPDRSHFRSMDIWHTASNSDEYLNTGWIGRLLDSNCKGTEHAWFAIEADDTLSLAMKGSRRSGFAVKDPKRLHAALSDPFYQQVQVGKQASEQESELSFLYKTLASTTSGADYIYEKSQAKPSSASYPQHELGKSLKEISGLIQAGSESRIYYTSISGFDTHVRQAETQQRLFQVVGDSLKSFCMDLKASGNFNDTVVMVFSEFGRRVKQNASNGTDHGTANSVFLLGGNLKNAGLRNAMPDLTKLDDGDLIHQLDFRRIYASLLDQGIGFDSTQILGRKFDSLDFI
ncbi:MAG TPA: DUF1501 domain-containing protein [Flavobacteriales bacterium]|nr:DUF1501 domain-containing protein [Flavobacteriales bacterium]